MNIENRARQFCSRRLQPALAGVRTPAPPNIFRAKIPFMGRKDRRSVLIRTASITSCLRSTRR